jgi:methylated-DNA-protein-cysteine methyltransferase-like protein
MNNHGSKRELFTGPWGLSCERRRSRERIYQVVAVVPRGQVATYGQIANIVGCSPREVGYAMAALPPASTIPWQRIINRHGRISVRSDGQPDAEQRRQLRKEGIIFDIRGVIDLSFYCWHGPSCEWLARYEFEPLPLIE